ncbi:MAG: tetratricopeptide repeat protein [Candidatus Omnitrophica bacterium]|nr:tetratricopeptide repeat protein [Candidatus Omnitrophota bacterium]
MLPKKTKIFAELLILLLLFALFVFVARDKIAAFFYNRGCSNYESGYYKEAIINFNNSLKFNPMVSKTHYSLGNTYDLDNQEEKAVEEYKKAIKIEPHFLWGYEALFEIYLRQGAFAQANALLKDAENNLADKDKFKDLVNLNSFKQASYYINKGINAFLEGNKPKGYEHLNIALKINPDFVLTCYSLGYFYYIDSRYDQALEMLKRANELDGNFLFTHKLMGDIYFSKKDFNNAIEEYKKALLNNDRDPVILNNLGLSFMNIEKYQEGVEFLEKAVKISPQNLNFRYSLASLYRDLGRTQESVAEYRKIIETKPDFPNIYNDLADIEKSKGNIKEALEGYQQEIKICEKKLLANPNDPMLLNNTAYAYNGLGEFQKAKGLIDQVLKVKPDYREAQLTLARIQRNLGEYEDSLASLEKAKKLSSQKQVFIEQKIEDLKEEFKVISREKINLQPFETVYLKNGRSFEGIIVGQNEDRIILQINIGNSIGNIMLSKKDIERIAKK